MVNRRNWHLRTLLRETTETISNQTSDIQALPSVETVKQTGFKMKHWITEDIR